MQKSTNTGRAKVKEFQTIQSSWYCSGAAAEAYCGSGPEFAELPALTADANDDANDAAATAAESSYDDADDVTFTNPNPTSPEEQNEGNN